jgi:hypothetical protein
MKMLRVGLAAAMLLVCASSARADFVTGNTSLVTTKADLYPIPTGANPNNYVVAADYNSVTQAAIDLRTALTQGSYHGLASQASAPAPVNASNFFWFKTDNTLHFKYGATDNQIPFGLATLQSAYNAGASGFGASGITITAANRGLLVTDATPTADLFCIFCVSNAGQSQYYLQVVGTGMSASFPGLRVYQHINAWNSNTLFLGDDSSVTTGVTLGSATGPVNVTVANNLAVSGTFNVNGVDRANAGAFTVGATNATSIQIGRTAATTASTTAHSVSLIGSDTANGSTPVFTDTTNAYTGAAAIFSIRNGGVQKAAVDASGMIYTSAGQGLDTLSAGTLKFGGSATGVEFASSVGSLQFDANATLYPATTGQGSIGSASNTWGVAYVTTVHATTIDPTSAGALNLGTSTANTINIGSSNVGSALTQTGGGGFVEFRSPNTYLTPTTNATSGTPLVNSPSLVLRAQYWTTSAQLLDNFIQNQVVTTGPTSQVAVSVQGQSFTFGSDGVFQSPGAQGSPAHALTDAATINTDTSTSNTFTVTLGGNRTLANPTNLRSGFTYMWIVKQDATGSRTLTYGTAFTWPGGVAPTLTTAANAVDLITAVYDGTKLRAVANANFQ